MIKFITDFIIESLKSPEQRYLENSKDVYELERRQKEISRGQAPHQLRYRLFSSNLYSGR